MAWSITTAALAAPSREAAPTGALEVSSADVSPALERARALYRQAIECARNGDWAEALPRFVQSNTVRPHAITAYNIGYSERALGHYTRARKWFATALADHEARGRTELSAEMIEVCRGYITELSKQLASVRVTGLFQGSCRLNRVISSTVSAPC